MSGKKKHQNVQTKTSPDGWIQKRQSGHTFHLPDHHSIMAGPFVQDGLRHLTKPRSSILKSDTKEKSSIVSPPKFKRVLNPYVVHSKRIEAPSVKEGAVIKLAIATKRAEDIIDSLYDIKRSHKLYFT